LFAGAIMPAEDGRYLMQLRDDKPGIHAPGALGLFGGHVEPGEAEEEGLRREIAEEIGYRPGAVSLFRHLYFPLEWPAGSGLVRTGRVALYELPIPLAAIGALRQTEGKGRMLISAHRLLLEPRVSRVAVMAIGQHAQARLAGPAPSEDRSFWPAEAAGED